MKKWAVIIAAVFILATAAASAPVQSITTRDTTQVISIIPSAGAEDAQQFKIFPVESKAAILQEIQRFYDFVNSAEGSRPPIQFFAEEEQEKLLQKLPEGFAPELLTVHEIQSIDEINYDQKFGDVEVEFEFATAYETGKAVYVLLGLTNADVSAEWDEDTDWNDNTEWVVLEAVALSNGHLLITFPLDVLVKMETANATTMVVFNEP